MSARAIPEQRATEREGFVTETTRGTSGVSAQSIRGTTIFPADHRQGHTLEPAAYELAKITDPSLLPVIRGDAADLISVLRQLGITAKLQAARIAFKAKGNILFLNLAEISAVEAQGNYVSLRHRTHPYLVHESLSSMAEKLKPYGFIRIHRSVVVNTSAVEEIQPLPSGEYRLRVKGGEEYMVTRTFKHNLSDLAQLWVGTGSPH